MAIMSALILAACGLLSAASTSARRAAGEELAADAKVAVIAGSGWEITEPPGFERKLFAGERDQGPVSAFYHWRRQWKDKTASYREEIDVYSGTPLKMGSRGEWPARQLCETVSGRILEGETVEGSHYGRPTFAFDCVDKDPQDNAWQTREHYYDVLREGPEGKDFIRLHYAFLVTSSGGEAAPYLKHRNKEGPSARLFRLIKGTLKPIRKEPVEVKIAAPIPGPAEGVVPLLR